MAADVSKVDDLQRLVDEAVNAFGRVDVMVDNSTSEPDVGARDHEEQYEAVMDINLKSAFFGTRSPPGR